MAENQNFRGMCNQGMNDGNLINDGYNIISAEAEKMKDKQVLYQIKT